MTNRLWIIGILTLLVVGPAAGCEGSSSSAAPSTDSDADSDSDSDSDADSDSDSDSDSDTDSDTDTDSDSDTDTDTDTDTDVDTDSDTDSDTDVDSDTDSDTGSSSGCVDEDSDWWCEPLDCSDSDSSINPGVDEVPDNGIDDDCDGLTDEAEDTATEYTGPTIPETCAAAAEILTSVGCEFYVVDLNNYVSADPLTYAVVVSNPQESGDAEVWIEDMRGPGDTLRTVPGMEQTLAPGELHIFELTCNTTCPETTTHVELTGHAPLEAFRIMADVPVLAYQWNTYGTGLETTDASLLIPTPTLGDQYIGAAWNYGPGTGDRTEITIVATEDDTQVTFVPTSNTLAGTGIPAVTAGDTSDVIYMDAFDVAQVAPVSQDLELTGTYVDADKPVAVFGGHSCAMVPSPSYYACDHVEEQLLPLVAWGTETVLARYAVRHATTAANDPALWRIVAGADDITVYFDPAVTSVGSSHYFATQGEMLEFESEIDHFAYAEFEDPLDPEEPEAPFFAFQMMTGRFYVGGSSYLWGDPMMLLSPPAGQYLDRYVFNTDSKFDFYFDRVIVVRPAGVEVEIDCLGVLDDGDFVSVGSTDWEVGRFALDYNGVDVGTCEDGAHWLEAAEPVGLSVVGEDFANSYGYLGGVGVRAINPVLN